MAKISSKIAKLLTGIDSEAETAHIVKPEGTKKRSPRKNAADSDALRRENTFNQLSLEQQFAVTLESLQCHFQVDTEGYKDSHRYYFDYQGGHFVAVFYKPYNVFELLFLNVMDVPLRSVDEMRSVLNHFNNMSIYHRFFYSKDASSTDFGVHISMTCNSVDQLSGRLESFFSTRRDVCDAIDDAVKRSAENEDIDLEIEHAIGAREMFLLQQQELAHQELKVDRTNGAEPITVGTVINTFTDRGRWRLHGIDVITDGTLTTVATNYTQYALHRALGIIMPPVGDTVSPSFEHSHATLLVHATEHGVRKAKEKIFTISLTADGSDSTSLYYRVQVLLPAEIASRDRSLAKEKPLRRQSYSFLVAYDLTDPKKKLAEFDYMWKDAQLKDRDKNAVLTDEEELLCQLVDPSEAFSTYWGRQYISEGRYFEALRHLETVYRSYRLNYFHMNDKGREAYFDICYYIGFCYNELGLYEKAYFYLEQLRESSRLSYCMELINTVVNAGDIRSFKLIDNIYFQIANEYDGEEGLEEDAPDHVKSFINFMRRRRAYASVDYGELDHAEKEFKELLNDPESHDYAIGELAYIKRLRDSGQYPAPSDNQSDDLPE